MSLFVYHDLFYRSVGSCTLLAATLHLFIFGSLSVVLWVIVVLEGIWCSQLCLCLCTMIYFTGMWVAAHAFSRYTTLVHLWVSLCGLWVIVVLEDIWCSQLCHCLCTIVCKNCRLENLSMVCLRNM